MILVTGGAGFVGSNYIHAHLACSDEPVVNYDSLTYAGKQENLAGVTDRREYGFVQGDINDAALLTNVLATYQPRAVIHFAAESHVDRSIRDPQVFIETNVNGSFRLLEACTGYWQALAPARQAAFRFLHVSTDEVYGSLAGHALPSTEQSPLAPNNPYSASKAAADHLVKAYHATYGLPALVSRCSNNYGPRQYPEKLIPLMIANARAGLPLALYGDGRQTRDWIHVSDHCSALTRMLEAGLPGQTYNVGAANELSNLQIVRHLCSILDELMPIARGSYADQIRLVADRPGHDRRYALDAGKLERELGWKVQQDFAAGLRQTIEWYARC